MALYEGKLERISGANIAHRHTNRIRQFVDIDGQRLKKVILPPYRDELLKEAVGEEVTLSTYGKGRRRNYVVGIRTPRGGVDKDSLGRMIVSMIAGIVAAAIIGLFLGGAAAFVGVAIFGDSGLALGAAVFLLVVLLPIYEGLKSFRAWAAL